MNLPRPVGAAVLLAVVTLAACTDDGGGSSSSSSGTDAAADVSPADVAPEPSAGCDAPAVVPGEEVITTTSGGRERTYFRHVPPGYDGSEPTPVVLDFHGYLEAAVVHVGHSELGPFGDEHGFITITPEGTVDPVPRWDIGFDSADMAYIGDLLDEIDETLCVDDRRVYATGLSNGAFFTSAVACVYADRIAAAAPVAGIRDIEGCEPARPVPVVAFHGTEDTYVEYDGGFGESAAELPNPDGSRRTPAEIEEAEAEAEADEGPSIPEITAAWAARNGCDPEPAEERVASDVVLTTFDCPPGADVELYTVEGGGHSWPASDFSASIESTVGVTTFSIDANEIMWDFFEQHPLRET